MNLTDQQKFLIRLSSSISLRILWNEDAFDLKYSKPTSTGLEVALQDMYLVDLDLYLLEGQLFRWIWNKSNGRLEIHDP